MARVFTRPLLPYANASKPQDSRYQLLSNVQKPPTAQMLDADVDYVIDSMELLSADIDAVVAGAIPGAEDPNNAGKLLTTDGNDPATLTWIQAGSNQIANGAVTQLQLANGAVGSSQIQHGAVSTAELGQQAVTLQNMAPASVGAPQLIPNCVATTNIQNAAITTQKLGSNVVTEGNMASGSVGNAQIQSGSVSLSSLSSGLQKQIFSFVGVWSSNSFDNGASFGVNSIIRNSTGKYTVTLSNPFNKNYRSFSSSILNPSDFSVPASYILNISQLSSSSLTVQCNLITATTVSPFFCQMVVSDLPYFTVGGVYLS